MKALGGDAQKINPLVPVDLVIDHSVMVDEFGHAAKAFEQNVADRIRPQRRALHFLKWGQGASTISGRPARHGHLPSGESGISGADRLDQHRRMTDRPYAYPDTCVGTDSHTTMVNGLAVLGWGVGGIEAEAAMLGQPHFDADPRSHRLQADRRSCRRRHRYRSRADCRRRCCARRAWSASLSSSIGPALAHLSLADRRRSPTWRPNMARPAASSRSIAETVAYLKGTGRDLRHSIALVEKYAKAQGMWLHTPIVGRPGLHRHAVARPGRPSSVARRPEASAGPGGTRSAAAAGFAKVMADEYKKTAKRAALRFKARFDFDLGHGDVVIAAITSCTNTSNPSVMMAPVLLARNAANAWPHCQSPG
jgi:aconitate hydratase